MSFDRPVQTCPYCGTVWHATSLEAATLLPGSMVGHKRRCWKATPAERAYYREHRQWPKSKKAARVKPSAPPVDRKGVKTGPRLPGERRGRRQSEGDKAGT